MKTKHWSKVTLLHEVVTNPNITIKGKHSYYSDCWDAGFEESVVRYLQGDEFSRDWEPKWKIDKLHIGDFVCIAAEVVIVMGGNSTHRADWFSLYPFMDFIEEAYVGKGDTHIGDGAWLGMRSMIMPGVTIGEGAIVAANSVVTKDVEPYSMVAGSPAKHIKYRFSRETIDELLALRIYDWPDKKIDSLKRLLCSDDLEGLKKASAEYDRNHSVE
ncbi:CatB-related O-acetyltransferase [Vibrio diabolicus]|uniref:CatB-related O-acetyltransferase n=1 Tax=Vibrio diabolicus TaxID=50719 RepID=UPI00215F644F|nr:CatB-related O-acetyltransferase [Vibrio diabolicus]MCS0307965.1 CatB-related O-acetyltransferase [Vibrio diabolicus]MCZ0739253.1 CatB-related O-acetyltransferase [Vibrio diabolicus]MEA3483048.1 CatB-related O-acetyltransferase [Pseudomonadota bacterium]